MQPVLEISAADNFALRPVGERDSYGYLVLNGELTPAEVGTAVMQIADCNDFEPAEEHGPCPTDPLGTFLHGLLTMPDLFAAGGFRVTENATAAEHVGAIVRRTFDGCGTDCSPVIELSVDQTRRLVAGARQDLQDFLGLAGCWAEQHLPAHATTVTAALAWALDLAPTQ